MNYKEKYENLIEKLKKAKEEHGGYTFSSVVDKIVPELKESEDERIRKELYKYFRDLQLSSDREFSQLTSIDEILTWLEKQKGKQDNNEDSNILQRFSFYSYKDEPNILYLSGLYVNEECRNKGIGTKILEVADEVAKSLNCHTIRLKTKKDSNAERLYRTHGYNSLPTEERGEIWLEKQGKQNTSNEVGNYDHKKVLQTIINEQNPTDKIEPKFKIGDWVQIDGGHVMKILDVKKDVLCYKILNWCGNESVRKISDIDSIAHLWTIEDAKDGDVLVNYNDIFLFDGTVEKKLFPFAYCGIIDGEFGIYDRKIPFTHSEYSYPATKEQSDFLFQKMKEAGYEWDVIHKELKKIQKEYKTQMIQWKGDNLKEIIDFTGKSKKFNDWFKTWEEYENYVHEHNNIFKLFNEDGSHFEVPVGAWIVKTPDGYNIASKSTFIQKHTWSEEDEEMLKDINDCIKNLPIFYETIQINGEERTTQQFIYSVRNWLKSLKDKVQSQPKQEWNKEDSERLTRIHQFIWANRKGDTDEIYQQEQDADWLMTLKPQPKQEWSEEDEYQINTILHGLDLKRELYKKEGNQVEEKRYKTQYDWLKSLKPNHWKPSEKQMKTLNFAANDYVMGETKKNLESLYNDLKNL